MTPEMLRRLPLLAGVPDEELMRIADLSSERTVDRGEVLIEEGSSPDAVYVVLEGEFDITKRQGKQDVLVNRAVAGEVLGELSVLAARPRSATVTSCSGGRVLELQAGALHELLASRTAAEAILRTVVNRLEGQEVQLRQHAKMAALGTLTAGLLHDLNNPAAAVSRSVARLRSALEGLGLAEAGGRERRGPDSPLERADLTDALEGWLADRDVDEAWEVAGALAEQGWRPDELADAVGDLPVAETARRLALGGEIARLLDELGEGTRRISEIVASVKSHSRHDEAPVQNVDVHELLDNTLVIMRHKLREGIAVEREYTEGQLLVEGYPSELNQVWTNLVDNAADAMDGRGTLRLRTSDDGEWATVAVSDTGAGIPPDIKDRIFDPFFTTKPVGQGSGIGLAGVFQIVTQRHRGSIDVASEPGSTTFTVRVPKRLAT